MYLLDTNVISELRKSGTDRINPGVRAWAQTVAADQLYLSVISLAELEMGVLALARKDPIQAEHLRVWLDQYVKVHFRNRIMSVTEAVALQYARINVPDRAPVIDGLIAATALAHNMVVVTRNITDFPWVATLDPFKSPPDPLFAKEGEAVKLL